MKLRREGNVQPSFIFEQSIFGVRLWLEQQWNARVKDPPLTVRIADSYNAERQIKLLGDRRTDRDAALELPYALIVPVTTGASTDRYNRFAVQTLGLQASLNRKTGIERREYVTPIDVGIGVKFVSNDINECNVISKIWAENTPDALIVVRQARSGAVFKLHLQFDGSVDLPQPADTSGNSPEAARLELQSTLILKTLCGTTVQQHVITRVNSRFLSGINSINNDPDTAVELLEIVRDAYKLSPERLAALGIIQA